MVNAMPRVILDNREISLSKREHRLLMLLMLARRRWVNLDQCMDWLYADSADPPFDQIISVFICLLRKRLAGTRLRVETLRGRRMWRAVLADVPCS